MRRRDWFHDVRAAFLRDTPHPREVIEAESARDIYIVPFMASDGYSIDTLIPDALRVSGRRAETVSEGGKKRVQVCQPLGTHDGALHWAVGRLAEFAAERRLDPTTTSVIVAAHGTDRHAGNFDRAREAVAALEARQGTAGVDAVFIDQEPRLATWRDRIAPETKTVLVLPLLMALGRHGRHDIPAAFGFENQGAAAVLAKGDIAGPFVNGSLRLFYGPLLGACPDLPDIAAERVRAIFAGQ